MLPSPELSSRCAEDSVPYPATHGIDGAISPRPESIPVPRESLARRLKVFEDKRVMLSKDLALGSRLAKVLEDLISGSNGSITESVQDADTYVCQYRAGNDYVLASQAGLDVGNLAWLYHMITHDEWTSPMRRLLHYPLPKDGIPGFENLKITLSNYGGDARVYLENLVLAAGAEFTKSMKQENTHLITARKASDKCTAAAEWNIDMVNHLWLEESYAKCEMQRLTDPRYTHFPPRTNLGEIIGQVSMDHKYLRSRYFAESNESSPGVSSPVQRAVMFDKDGNAGTDVLEAQDDKRDKLKKPAVTAKRRSRLEDSALSASTPVTKRPRIHGKENETPSSTSSRGAKDRAISMLHNLAPDIAEYQRESKRRGTVWGGDRAANRLEREQLSARGSSPLIQEPDEDPRLDDVDGMGKQKAGKAKTANPQKSLPPIEIRLLVTGYQGWLGNPTKEDVDKVNHHIPPSTDFADFTKRKLRDMGIMITSDPSHCTHIAAPSIIRTQKFLCGLANGPSLLRTEFIDACIKQKSRPEIRDFVLKDATNERRFNCKLKDIIGRAKANKRSLLRGIPIYCTPDIDNGTDTFKAIVEANGGTFLPYRGRGGAMIKPVNPEDDPLGPEPVYLLTGEKPSDRQLWSKFEDMAKAGNMIPRIVHQEWLLDTALSQELIWNDEYLVARS